MKELNFSKALAVGAGLALGVGLAQIGISVVQFVIGIVISSIAR